MGDLHPRHLHLRQAACLVHHHRHRDCPAWTGQDWELHLGGHWDRYHKDCTLLLFRWTSVFLSLFITFPLRTLCLQWLELPQLCDWGDEGPSQRSPPSNHDLLYHRHHRLRDNKHSLLHNSQCAWSPWFWGSGCGEFCFGFLSQIKTINLCRHLLAGSTANLPSLSPWRWLSRPLAESTASFSHRPGSYC